MLIILIFSGCLSNENAVISGEYSLVSYGVEVEVPALEDVETFIRFDLDGEFSGNVGCNSFSGKYTIDGDELTISNLVSTEMYCEKTSAQESTVLGILSSNNLHFVRNGIYATITSGVSRINLKLKP